MNHQALSSVIKEFEINHTGALILTFSLFAMIALITWVFVEKMHMTHDLQMHALERGCLIVE